jgi:Sec-independent protein translocase protein TatA
MRSPKVGGNGMNVDLLVDWVVIIWGSLILISLILAIVFGFLLYRRIKSISKSIKATLETAKLMRSDVVQALKSSKDVFAAFKSVTVESQKQTVCEEKKEESIKT